MRRKAEKGAGTLKAIIALAILAAMAYGCLKIVPHYVNNYQLQDAMKTEARFAGVERKTADQVRSDIYARIHELGIPAKPEDILVDIDGQGFRISVKYKVLVDFPGYELVLNFQPSADSHSI